MTTGGTRRPCCHWTWTSWTRTQCDLQTIHIFAVSTYLYLCPFHIWLQHCPLGSHACVVSMVQNGHPVFWPGKEECDLKVFFLNSKWESCKKLSSPSFLYPQEVWGTKEDGWTEIIPEKRWEPPEWFPQSCWLFTTRKLACLEIPIELSGSAGLTGNIHRAWLETLSGKGKPAGSYVWWFNIISFIDFCLFPQLITHSLFFSI